MELTDCQGVRVATDTDSLDCHDCMLYGGIRVARGSDSMSGGFESG